MNADRPTHVLMDEIENRMISVFGQDNHFGFTFIPGIEEYDINVWYKVQYPKDDPPDFSKEPLSKLEWDKQIAIRNAMRPGSVVFKSANGATRDDAIRALWKSVFEFEGHY